jgi:hypothetical protein
MNIMGKDWVLTDDHTEGTSEPCFLLKMPEEGIDPPRPWSVMIPTRIIETILACGRGEIPLSSNVSRKRTQDGWLVTVAEYNYFEKTTSFRSHISAVPPGDFAASLNLGQAVIWSMKLTPGQYESLKGKFDPPEED